MTTRGLLVGLVALALAVSCGADELEEAPLHCGSGPTARGNWTVLRQPEEVLISGIIPGVVFSNGQRLWTTDGRWLGTLEPGSVEWSVTETVPTPGSMDLMEFPTAAGEDYLSGFGIAERTRATVEVLDLAQARWSSYNLPESWGEAAYGLGGVDAWIGASLWSVGVFVRQSDGDEQVSASYAVFDTVTETWRTGTDEVLGAYAIPSAPLNNATSFAWSDSSLFLWGPLRDGSTVFMRSFNVETETWSTLPTEGGPGVRVGAGMLADGQGHLFVHGGKGPSRERPALRQLWRFDLDDQIWTQLDVPEWVDPALGAVIDGKLYFIGSCSTGAVYDPSEDSWEQLPVLAALQDASGTQLRLAGGRLAISGIFYHPHTHVPDVFLFDPSGRTSVTAGAGGVDSGQ